MHYIGYLRVQAIAETRGQTAQHHAPLENMPVSPTFWRRDGTSCMLFSVGKSLKNEFLYVAFGIRNINIVREIALISVFIQ